VASTKEDAMRICFTFNGVRWCFDIPILYDPWWWLHPEGPRGGDTGDFGEVINWVTVDGRTAEWAREAQLLATTVSLARRSPAIFKGLQAGFEQAAENIKQKLHEGATIHFAT
jgi:hypothetical protein